MSSPARDSDSPLGRDGGSSPPAGSGRGAGDDSGAAATTTVRLALPPHLETLAGVRDEVELEVPAPPTMAGVLDALEARFPVLEGTIRHHRSSERRALIRFWAGGRDLSHEPMDATLPREVEGGGEVVHVVGALAGG